MLEIRPVRWPQDRAALEALDASFTTDRIYRLVQEEWISRLVEETIDPPLTKRYELPLDPDERHTWDYAAVAEMDGEPAGFIAVQRSDWNRRAVIQHLYAAPAYRRLGVGTRLLEAAEIYARSIDMRCLWLETQNVNYPAVQFYRRSGFRFCGFDDVLYDPEILASEEIALFFTRPVSV